LETAGFVPAVFFVAHRLSCGAFGSVVTSAVFQHIYRESEEALGDWLRMANRIPVAAALLLCAVMLDACGPRGATAQPNYTGIQGPQPGDTTMLGDSALTFGVNKNTRRNTSDNTGGALGVNAYLWRGALDTLSFMPLASADPFGGVIITDWYTPPTATNERFKATAYILGRELRSDGIRITIFRQVLQDGQWVDASVSPMTIGEIENKVLSRARELREASQASS
jgi:hypothetical protein